jgi:16S rRNA (guanine966-N2)-methyltransferase
MRIIAGTAKGRRLVGPGKGTRPMTDRAKEALFSSLGDVVVDADVFDLFAGTGSLGLEALSRGAKTAVFVEQDRNAAGILRRNVEAVGLGGEVVVDDVERFLRRTDRHCDLAFVDPPYARSLASVYKVLEALEPHLHRGAVVVVHRRAGEDLHDAPLPLIDRRRYGDSVLWVFRKENA